MFEIMHNKGLLTTLAERWHNEHNTFHLPTGEISVTLEDVYRILHIPVTGELVQYDYQDQVGIEACKVVFADESIGRGEIRWVDMVMYYKALPVILASLIGGLYVLIGDHEVFSLDRVIFSLV